MNWLHRLLPPLRRRAALRDLGAEFVRDGRDTFAYVEGAKRLPIYCELQGRGDVDFVLNPADAIGDWLPPHEAEPLSAARKQEILELFLRYLAIFDHSVAFEGGAVERPRQP